MESVEAWAKRVLETVILRTRTGKIKWDRAGQVGELAQVYLAVDKGLIYDYDLGAHFYVHFVDPLLLEEVPSLKAEDRGKGIAWVKWGGFPARMLHIGGPFWQKEMEKLGAAIQAQTKI